jgi:hypothetical protein
MKRAIVAALWCSLPALAAENSGQAEIGAQGYSLGGNGQPAQRIGGLLLSFREFFPGLGLLNGHVEGYENGQFQTGDNYLELQGLPWLGRRWSFRGGDFQTPAMLVDFPFHNVFTPELTARGAQISSEHGSTRYELFWGKDTLEEGPLVPFRITAPQTVVGASAQYKRGRLHAGVRYLRFESSLDEMRQNPSLFPSGRDFGTVDTLTAQTLYRINRNLLMYGEVSQALAGNTLAAAPGAGNHLSAFGGSAWETPKLTARVTYARQGVLYFPLAGYYAGDRVGPFAEVQYRPRKSVELTGSAGHYRNNLEHNPEASTFRSTSVSVGANVQLPWTLNGSAQLSSIKFAAQPGGAGLASSSNNLHMSASLARPFRRHTVRISVDDLKLTTNWQPQRQRWAEAEDTFRIKRLMLGADVRMQQAITSERRNTVYVRGSMQLNTRRLTLFANAELGDDLLNQSVFATNTYRTTVVGITAHLGTHWDLQAEAFRNSLNQTLNPESIFLLETGGVGLSNALSSLNQWSVLIRLKHQVQWGRPMPSGGLDRYVASQLPLAGTVEGFVYEQRMTGRCAAAGIPVSLENGRTVSTDADGRFRFNDVGEGVHRVLLSRAELPADYDPGTSGEASITVRPRHTTSAELTVVRLTSLSGVVTGPDKARLEHILIRLLPTARYTTTDAGGRFAFHNLREGDYEVTLDELTLPEGGSMRGASVVPTEVRLDDAAPEINFRFSQVEKQKPVRKIELPGQLTGK